MLIEFSKRSAGSRIINYNVAINCTYEFFFFSMRYARMIVIIILLLLLIDNASFQTPDNNEGKFRNDEIEFWIL